MTLSSEARSSIRHWTYFLLIFGVVIAQPAFADVAAGADVFDATFWFRAVFTALVSVLIWIAKGSDTRVKNIESRIKDFNEINVARTHKIDTMDGRLTLVEHEQKQLFSLVSMQRELLLTKYLDKESTEVHRTKVEEALAKHQETLITICHRLDHFVRPAHRSEDDDKYRTRTDDHNSR